MRVSIEQVRTLCQAARIHLHFQRKKVFERMNPLLVDQLLQREPAYKICPTQNQPVIAMGDDGYEMKGLRWGLVPGWAKDLKIGAHAINARQETVRTKPMFRAAFKHAKHRCLVPATGYYEWTGDPGSKQPWFIYHPDHSLMLFAGLWEAWKDKTDPEAEWVRTFTILTGEPGKVSKDVHDRQPVILPPDLWEKWLTCTADEAEKLLAEVPEAELVYHPVTKAVSSPKNQGETLVEPVSIE
jgi:putative SOS response-associated peptidase YedK